MTEDSPHTAALVAGVAAAALLLYILLSRRAADTPSSHWLLLLGLALLPGAALLLGTGATIEQAKKPAFCGSCHVMQPFIRDMNDPASTTLASVHYQNRYILHNQCYTCHTDYTIFGPLTAKFAGVRHLWNYETGRYSIPIKLRGAYNIQNCLHCHGEAKIFQDKHEPVVRQMLGSGEASCLDCHQPVHPEQGGGS